jgi:MFS family permease
LWSLLACGRPPGVLIVPFENEFHWSRATISFAIGINLLVYGLVGPFAAAAMDRFGVRRTMTLSLGVAGAYLAGVFRLGFGTYFEAFILAGLLCIAAALMVLFIGTGQRGVAEPAPAAKAYL